MEKLDKLVSRLEKVTAKLESLGASRPQLAPKPAHLGGSGGASADAPPHVKAYDSALSDVVERWAGLSKQIGGDVLTMSDKVMHVLESLKNFLWMAAGRSEPSPDEVQKLCAPIVNLLKDI
ncbi:unnamed protein product, partial [Strongylus vulgaris]